MRVTATKVITDYLARYQGANKPALDQALKAWLREARHADWRSPHDIKAQYRSASILRNNRVVFNICGSKFRLVIQANYAFKIVRIKWVGTHAEYNDIKAEEV